MSAKTIGTTIRKCRHFAPNVITRSLFKEYT